jgi:membrane-associated protein
MTSTFAWIFNDHGVEHLLQHDLLTGWFTIGAVVYFETAIIFLLFLPVDSLVFAAGAFVGAKHGSIALPVLIFSIAALLGDVTAFTFAHSRFGHAMIHGKWISRVKIQRTRTFFKKYGPAAIIACRFIGFARSFSPLAAGLSKIRASHYVMFDAIGCIAWTTLLLTIGYRLGKVSWVQLHLTFVSVVLVLAALLVFAIQGLVVYLRRHK